MRRARDPRRRRLTAWRYLLGVALVATLAVGGTVGLNLAIDRSGFYPSEQWNTQTTVDRKLRAAQAKAVLIGSSRISVFPLDDATWGDAPAPRALFPLSGAQFGEMVDAFQRQGGYDHAQLVIFALDFYAFNALRDYDDLIHPYSLGQEVRRFVRFTVPLQTLADRIRNAAQVLAYQFKKLNAIIAGRTEEMRPPAPPPVDEARPYRDTFERSIRLFWTNYLGNKYGDFRLEYPLTRKAPGFDALDRLIGEVERRKINLLLFVHPSHAWEREIWRHIGIEPVQEDWLRRLTARVARADPARVALWDFGGYTCITTERVPVSGAMRWYDDVGHYKQDRVGPLILRRMIGGEAPGPAAPCPGEEFGRRLTPETIEAVLAAARAGRAPYAAARGDEIAVIDRIAGERAIRAMPHRLW